MSLHKLSASPETVSWGRFSAAQPAVLEVQSGDTVVIETLSGNASVFPPPDSGMTVSPALRAINAAGLPVVFGHLLTGPVHIAGAVPGDVLEVRIDDVALGADWGFNAVGPFVGTLPGEFPVSTQTLTHIPIDRQARTARLPWGAVLPLKPFFGVMGVAPPAHYGEITSREPRVHGGNIDNRLLTAGATLYLPVWAEGALFSCGDGHGCQGDGEVCITALETALTGTFTFILHKQADRTLSYPRAETPTSLISMGFAPDLDEALRIAVREMIAMIGERVDISQTQAYQLCSLAADFAVTQSVNGEKGVHGRLDKALLHNGPPAPHGAPD
jgi:acetamidase/formamidase